MTDTDCVLVADGSLGSAVQAARLLSKDGFAVHTICLGDEARVVGSSRHCTSVQSLRNPQSEELCATLLEWGGRHTPASSDVSVPVIPLSDRAAGWLDEHRESLAWPLALGIPDREVLRPLLSKESALRAAGAAGLDVPAWRAVRTSADVLTVSEIDLPIIVKPLDWSSVGGAYFKQMVFRQHPHLQAFLAERVSLGGAFLAQHFVHEPPASIVFGLADYDEETDVASIVTGRKEALSSAEGGVMAWGRSVAMPDVEASCLAFLRHTGFNGVGGIEFIRSGGRLWFIEFNPRPEAIHFLADASGVPQVTRWAWRLAGSGVLPIEATSPRPHSAAVWVESAWLARLSTDRRAVKSVPGHLFRYLRHGRRASALMSAPDPGPMGAYSAGLFRQGVRRLTHGGRTR